MGRAISKIEISRKKRNAFLKALALSGRVSEAAHACGYQDTAFLHKCRRNDEDFAEQWDLALQAAGNVLEAEIWRRAHDGVLEPQYYKGSIVGYTTKYSDTLAMFILRKIDPSYRDSHGRGGETNINFGIAVLPMTAQSDEQWEQRALTMHGNQKVIEVEAKPVENNLARIQRGD